MWPGPLQPRHALGIRPVRCLQVSAGPATRARPAPPPLRAEVVVLVERGRAPAGRASWWRRRSPGPGPARRGGRRSTPGSRRNASWSTTTISVDALGELDASPASNHRSASRRRDSTPVDLAARQQRRGVADAEHRPDANDLVGERLQPADAASASCRLLLHRRHRPLDQVRRALEVARRPSRGGWPRPARRSARTTRSPAGAGPAPASGCSSSRRALQHVGEQVVVAVPLAAVVERDEEQVPAVQRLQHGLAAVLLR